MFQSAIECVSPLSRRKRFSFLWQNLTKVFAASSCHTRRGIPLFARRKPVVSLMRHSDPCHCCPRLRPVFRRVLFTFRSGIQHLSFSLLVNKSARSAALSFRHVYGLVTLILEGCGYGTCGRASRKLWNRCARRSRVHISYLW